MAEADARAVSTRNIEEQSAKDLLRLKPMHIAPSADPRHGGRAYAVAPTAQTAVWATAVVPQGVQPPTHPVWGQGRSKVVAQG
jgi:hypothetical protein